MQSTGQSGEKRSYRVILLLVVVGLAAFSSAMKELNQVQELTLQTSQLIAQWSGKTDMPQTKTVNVIHFQKRDGRQCSRSSSLQ